MTCAHLPSELCNGCTQQRARASISVSSNYNLAAATLFWLSNIRQKLLQLITVVIKSAAWNPMTQWDNRNPCERGFQICLHTYYYQTFYTHEAFHFIHTDDSFLFGNGAYILFMRFPNNENSQEMVRGIKIERVIFCWCWTSGILD